MMAVLWGDPTSGPSGIVLKMPPGFETPVHTHTASYRAIVLSGEATHWLHAEDRKNAEPAGPGSYILQRAGEWHGDLNAGGEEAVVLVIYDGPVDFLLQD